MTPLLQLRELSVGYQGRPLLESINMEGHAGQVIGIMGTNGCGKSTLLKTFIGLVPGLQGTVQVAGEDVTGLDPVRRVQEHSMAYLPQKSSVFSSLTVRENLRLCVRDGLWGKRDEAIDLLLFKEPFACLRAYLEVPAATLSGGQKGLLGLARILMMQGRILLLDEPGTGLAPALRDVVIDTLKNYALGRLIVVAEQSMHMLFSVCNCIYVVRPAPSQMGASSLQKIDGCYIEEISSLYARREIEKAEQSARGLLGMQ